jgi:hypothetical protein
MTPIRNRVPAYLLLSTVLVGLSGCASIAELVSSDPQSNGAPVVTAPTSPEEDALGRLGGLPAGENTTLMDGARVTAEPIYAAASGRRCRWVTLTYPGGKPDRRLACAVGGGWQWATTVTVDLSR